ncbi:MAG: hypothetical protein ACFFAZ_16125, partial [Promethearchaeota archaeon]
MTSTRDILKALTSGKIDIEEAEAQLRSLAVVRIGDIGTIDVSRREQSGVPEVIYAESKNTETLTEIVGVVAEKNGAVLLSRVSKSKLEALEEAHQSLIFDVVGYDDHLTV